MDGKKEGEKDGEMDGRMIRLCLNQALMRKNIGEYLHI